MRYLPHTDEDISSMLQTVGLESLEELFSVIPIDYRNSGDLNLPEALSEWELIDHMQELANKNAFSPEYKIFLGAGNYEHFVPAAVTSLLSRSEFYTSYTPYQPEMSQGILQAIYEYQTLIGRLLGMEVAMASHYDGATALAESLLMSIRLTKRKKVAVSRLVNPLYRRVVKTYLEPTGYQMVELGYQDNGLTDLSGLEDIEDLACLAIQSPNFFGCIEDLQSIAEKVHEQEALLVSSFSEALSYGLLKSPGSQGADIVCGEGQSLGIPQSFGGPGLGILTSRKSFMRSLPGRLVGKTKDLDGRLGFVLTIATREQHIRREKATSNICTNNSLCALAAAMYMACVGRSGLRELAQLNHDKAEYLKTKLLKNGFSVPFSRPTFNEFVVKFPEEGFQDTYQSLMDKKIVPGLPLSNYYPELADHYLICVTETKTREDMDALVKEIT